MIPRNETRAFMEHIDIVPATWADRLMKLAEEIHEYKKSRTKEEAAKELADISIVADTIREKAYQLMESMGLDPVATVRSKMKEVVDRGR